MEEQKYRLRKILYLSGRDGMTVRADGPSLTVRAPQQAERRFPLARLEGMAVEGVPEIPFEVIRICAAQGIPVALLSRSGDPFGIVLPWRGKRDLRSKTRRWSFRNCASGWFRKAEQARKEAFEEAGIASEGLDVQESIRRLLEHWGKGPVEVHLDVYRRLRAMLAAAVNRELGRVGVRGDEKACGPWTAQRLITDVESWRLCRAAGRAEKPGLEEAARIWDEIKDETEARCRRQAAWWAGENLGE